MNSGIAKSHPAAWVTGCVVLFFAAALMVAAPHNPLTFDNASNAILAKNLAFGAGWGSWYHAHNLAPPLSTGPTVILPGALLMAVLGNPVWAPALAAAILNSLLLSLLAWRLYRLCPKPWQAAALISGLVFFFALGHSAWWLHFVGEIPALLLVLLAATVAVDTRIRSEFRRYLLLGLLAGLALLCRMNAIPGLAAIALYMLGHEIRGLRAGTRNWRALAQCTGIGLAATVTLIGAFLAYIAIEAWRADSQTLMDYFQNKKPLFGRLNDNIGLRGALRNPDSTPVWSAVSQNAALLTRVLRESGFWPYTLPLGLVWIIGSILAPVRPMTTIDRFGTLVLGILCLYFLWFYPSTIIYGLERYTVQIVLLITVALCVLASRCWAGVSITALCLIALFSATADKRQRFGELTGFRKVQWLKQDLARISAAPELYRYHEDLQATARFIESETFRYPLANCGWITETVELEYVLPKTGNFLDCYRLIESALVLDEADYFSRYPDVQAQISQGDIADARTHWQRHRATHQARYRWQHEVNFTLVVNRTVWRLSKYIPLNRERHKALMQACGPHVRYRSPWYLILECRFDNLMPAIPLDGNTPFVNAPPEWSFKPQ